MQGKEISFPLLRLHKQPVLGLGSGWNFNSYRIFLLSSQPQSHLNNQNSIITYII